MDKKIVRRQSADKTRSRIIKSAHKLFAEHGFSGTSTLAIAKAAEVNETLIFHHFGNKAELWKTVKDNLLNDLPIEPLDKQPANLRLFLEKMIYQRVSAYQARPDLIRLLQWQRLESKQDKLAATHVLTPQNWLAPIEYLQKTGKINTLIDAQVIMIWLQASINAILFDNIAMLQDETKRTVYIAALIDGFEKALG